MALQILSVREPDSSREPSTDWTFRYDHVAPYDPNYSKGEAIEQACRAWRALEDAVELDARAEHESVFRNVPVNRPGWQDPFTFGLISLFTGWMLGEGIQLLFGFGWRIW